MTYLKILNPIYYGSLRLVLGAFRTSPVESLYADANEAPAGIKANKFSIQYYVKLKSCPLNPAYESTFHSKYEVLYQKSEKAIKHFDLWMEKINEKARVD